ncbi:hypothetical protein [Brucella pituitosa]|uniref:hypothetical protein n=1 Tax=Brucella pituitosa TaxID=571256 RepID=UPI001260311E|nr:hypothetical protein [Brucella pituitosa]
MKAIVLRRARATSSQKQITYVLDLIADGSACAICKADPSMPCTALRDFWRLFLRREQLYRPNKTGNGRFCISIIMQISVCYRDCPQQHPRNHATQCDLQTTAILAANTGGSEPIGATRSTAILLIDASVGYPLQHSGKITVQPLHLGPDEIAPDHAMPPLNALGKLHCLLVLPSNPPPCCCGSEMSATAHHQPTVKDPFLDQHSTA